MAKRLASKFATENDTVNCPFYFKTGACRHGYRCSRRHTKPAKSPTLLLRNIYHRPKMITPIQPNIHPPNMQQHFEDFYKDLYGELSKYGEIESLNVCDNLAPHLVGNVYVQFKNEEHAANAFKNLTGRYYAGWPVIVDFSPVTDFRAGACKHYVENNCKHGGSCSFMHLKRISRELQYNLLRRPPGRHSRSRSRSPYRHCTHASSRMQSSGHDDPGYPESRSRSPRTTAPIPRKRSSRSPRDKSGLSPSKEESEERPAKIQRREREADAKGDGREENDNDGKQRGE